MCARSIKQTANSKEQRATHLAGYVVKVEVVREKKSRRQDADGEWRMIEAGSRSRVGRSRGRSRPFHTLVSWGREGRASHFKNTTQQCSGAGHVGGRGGHETKRTDFVLSYPKAKLSNAFSSFPASLSPLFWSCFFVPFPSFLFFGSHFFVIGQPKGGPTFVFSQAPGGGV